MFLPFLTESYPDKAWLIRTTLDIHLKKYLLKEKKNVSQSNTGLLASKPSVMRRCKLRMCENTMFFHPNSATYRLADWMKTCENTVFNRI